MNHYRPSLLALTLLLPWTAVQPQSEPVSNPWLLCEPDPLAGYVIPDTGADPHGPIELTADTGESSPDQAILEGGVTARKGDRRLEARRVTFDRRLNRINTKEPVIYSSPDLVIRAEEASVNLEDNTGWFTSGQFYFPQRNAQGNARRVEVNGERKTSEMERATYSTCVRGHELWQLRARRLELDQRSGRAVARDATFALGGVPVLYYPYISFPIDGERHSGFLTPAYSIGDVNGLEIRVPFYWNIAPNQDMTFMPRIFSNRGLMLNNEYRLLTPKGQGQTNLEYLPYDAERKTDRGAVYTSAQVNPFSNWFGDFLYQDVSDNDYLDDFSDKLGLLTNDYLERHADLSYQGGNWLSLLRVQNYRVLDEAKYFGSDNPYNRTPQWIVDGNWDPGILGLNPRLRSEVVHFRQGERVDGTRLDLYPSLSLPLLWPAGFLTPQAGYRLTRYELAESDREQFPSSPNRAAPIASLDGGLFFERPVDSNWLLGAPGILTLEPRLFYLYVPYRNQEDLPVFDTTLLDRSASWLFYANRFTGADRLGDANQLTTALTSRLLDPASGAEYFRFTIGQIQYFEDRRVTLPDYPILSDDNSAVITELFARLSQNWSLVNGLQLSPSFGNIRRVSFGLRYLPSSDYLINLRYTFSQPDEETPQISSLNATDLSLVWTLNDRWRTVARWNYSLKDSINLDAFAGFEYESCCWSLRLLARQSRDEPEDDPKNAVLFQFEFKGLTDVGKNLPAVLEEAIMGYQPRSLSTAFPLR